ncbi:HD domain-containing protein, partial [Bacteroidota bacterium]
MGTSLQENLNLAETQWLSLLQKHCKQIFDGVFLPSHDHLHHLRVWSHARTLLLLLDGSGIELPPTLPEELIMAVFFHDVGLARTPGVLHGQESRKLCEEFVKDLGSGHMSPGRESLNRILHSIEHHDDKSLKTSIPRFSKGAPPDLLSLLSASDDLDAFGRMGIYRYAEIYLLRGITPTQLPGRVCTNVQNRFNNLQNAFGEFEEFINLQENRFRQVYDFYLSLSQAFASSTERTSWEPVLIEIIYEALLGGQNLLRTDRILPQT